MPQIATRRRRVCYGESTPCVQCNRVRMKKNPEDSFRGLVGYGGICRIYPRDMVGYGGIWWVVVGKWWVVVGKWWA